MQAMGNAQESSVCELGSDRLLQLGVHGEVNVTRRFVLHSVPPSALSVSRITNQKY